MQGAKNNTGNIRAGNIGNAEVLLSNVGHGKAERHADDGDALGVGVALVIGKMILNYLIIMIVL